MYESFDEDIFLAPESVVAGVVAMAALDDEVDSPDIEPPVRSWRAPAPDVGAQAVRAMPHVDETASIEREGRSLDAWARHAGAANGFGD